MAVMLQIYLQNSYQYLFTVQKPTKTSSTIFLHLSLDTEDFSIHAQYTYR